MEQVSVALATSSEIGDRWSLPQINMIRARILQETDSGADAAEACLRTAIDASQSQSAKGFELRAATSLARLWRDQGKVRQARELLDPVYGWFTEGFDTRDLKEAKALLNDLAA
jgi:predicted ATPase